MTYLLNVICRPGFSSILLWIWPLFMLIISRRREVEDYSIIDRSALLQIGFTLACLVLTFFEVRKKRINLLRYCWMRPIRWVFLFSLLCGLSTLWSISPTYTAWRVIEAFVFLFLWKLRCHSSASTGSWSGSGVCCQLVGY